MTGSGQAPMITSLRNHKIDGWLSKPFDLNRLSDMMTTAGLLNAFCKGRPPRKTPQAS
jgi:hypothetical protein